MKNKVIVLSIAAFAAALSTQTAQAAGNCEIVYGGGEVCPPSLNFTVNKTVQQPTKGGTFVDNLGVNDAKYGPDSEINFQITIKNTGNKTINKIDVTDTLPNFLTFKAGVGNISSDKKTVTFTINNLEADRSVVYTIVTKAASASELPSDSGVTCVTNEVKAIADNQAVNTDSSQVCIEKNIVGTPSKPQVFPAPKVTSTPSTGPEMLGLIGLIPSGIAGFLLRKKAK